MFSGMVRGVSNACEGSKIITFLFQPQLVRSSLLHLLRLWKVNSANFALTAFSKVRNKVVKILQLSDAPAPYTRVCCVHHMLRGRYVKARDRYLASF